MGQATGWSDSAGRTSSCTCASALAHASGCLLQIEADISKRYGGRPVNLMGTSL